MNAEHPHDADSASELQVPHDPSLLRGLGRGPLSRLQEASETGAWPTTPLEGHPPHGWDSIVDPWIEMIPVFGDKIPSAYRIWCSARRYLLAGERQRADRAERLNYLLHNSYVPAALDLRGEIHFAYGGIGVILHHDADIYPGVSVGAHVTVGGSGRRTRIDERTGKQSTLPCIKELCTLGAASNITGGITLGAMTIVAPNAVVTHSTEPGTIVGGIPARPLGTISMNSALRYKSKFPMARGMSDREYLNLASRLLTEG